MSNIARMLRSLPIYVTTGKTEKWSTNAAGYFPCLDTGTRNDSFNTSGALAVTQISDITGLVAWKDYIPVMEATGATAAFSLDGVGYIPIKVASGSIFALPPDTWDPSRLASGATLSNGDLTLTTGVSTFNECTLSAGIKSTTGIKAYFEVLIVTKGGTGPWLGMVAGNQAANASLSAPYVCQDLAGLLQQTGYASGAHGTAIAAGDVWGMTFDRTTPGAATVVFYKNGVANGNVVTNNWSATATCSISAMDRATANQVVTLRTTAAEFSYPVPSGFTAWGAIANV